MFKTYTFIDSFLSSSDVGSASPGPPEPSPTTAPDSVCTNSLLGFMGKERFSLTDKMPGRPAW